MVNSCVRSRWSAFRLAKILLVVTLFLPILTSCKESPDSKVSKTRQNEQTADQRVVSNIQQQNQPTESQGIFKQKIVLSGKGKSEKDAIIDALIKTVTKIPGLVLTNNEIRGIVDSRYASDQIKEAKTVHSDINVTTPSPADFIRNYTVLESKKTGFLFFEEYTVKTAVILPQKNKTEHTITKIKLAIVPLRTHGITSGALFSGTWMRDLEVALIQSGKFAMLDRSFDDITKNQTNQYASGEFSDQELTRRGQRAGADYIVTGELMKGTSPEKVRLRIIDIATGKVKYARNYGANSIDAFNDIIEYFYPLTLIGMNGPDVIIGQGGERVVVGQKYSVFWLSSELKDPYTVETVDRIENPIGTIEVTSTGLTTSIARVISGNADIQAKINDRLIIRKQRADVMPDIAPGKKTKSKAANKSVGRSTSVKINRDGGVMLPFDY